MSSDNLQYAVCCLKKKLNNNTLPTEVRDALLSAISPSETNRFITAEEITDFVTETELNTAISNLTEIVVVENYSALPDATLHTGEFYWAENSQGTKWLPFSLGGTFYNSGLYYSNGVTWTFLEVPYQATQDEVITGTNNDKFVTPLTLTGKLNIATFTVDLSSDLTVDFYAPYDLKINSVTNIVNAPTTTISVNSGSYTLGNLIDQGDMITVDVDVNGVINLNVVYE